MKTILLIFLISMFGGSMVKAQQVEQPEPNTSDQLEEYLSILDKGQHSASLYINIGYSYYHQGDMARAILFYEKALKIDPRDKTITDAIDQIRAELPVQITEIPDFVLIRAYRLSTNLLSASAWSVVQLILSFFLLLFSYLILWKRIGISGIKQWTLIGLLIALIIITSLFAYHKRQYERGGNTGISMAVQEMYTAPDERSGSVMTLGPGNKVFLLDSIGLWYKVQVRDKDVGWVKQDDIEII